MQVIILNTGENCLTSDKSYEIMASLGSGNIFDVCKTDISTILKFIKTSMYLNCKVNLLFDDNPQSQTVPSIVKLSIDKSITTLMIIVSGLNCKFDVMDPNGEKIEKISQKSTADLHLKNVKVVSIQVS